MNIGQAIKRARKQAKLPQNELSRKVQISQTALSQIENGVKKPSGKTLKKIVDALGTCEFLLLIDSVEQSDIPEGKQDSFDKWYPSLKELAEKIFK